MNSRHWSTFLGVAAIVVSLVIYVTSSADMALKCAIAFGVLLLMSLIVNFLSPKERGGLGRFHREMGSAFRELLDENPIKVIVYSYIGNFTWEALCNGDYPDNLQIRLLVRDPGAEAWRYPPIESGRQEVQKGRIANAVINRLAGDEVSSRLAHNRVDAPRKAWVRFYQHEPTLRFVIATYASGRRAGFLGFYPLQTRTVEQTGCEVLDYSGRKRPVVRIDESNEQSKSLIADFVNWFEHFWENVALTEPSA